MCNIRQAGLNRSRQENLPTVKRSQITIESERNILEVLADGSDRIGNRTGLRISDEERSLSESAVGTEVQATSPKVNGTAEPVPLPTGIKLGTIGATALV